MYVMKLIIRTMQIIAHITTTILQYIKCTKKITFLKIVPVTYYMITYNKSLIYRRISQRELKTKKNYKSIPHLYLHVSNILVLTSFERNTQSFSRNTSIQIRCTRFFDWFWSRKIPLQNGSFSCFNIYTRPVCCWW